MDLVTFGCIIASVLLVCVTAESVAKILRGVQPSVEPKEDWDRDFTTVWGTKLCMDHREVRAIAELGGLAHVYVTWRDTPIVVELDPRSDEEMLLDIHKI